MDITWSVDLIQGIELMKLHEILDTDAETIKSDVKYNKGKAITAIVRGAKRKANNSKEDFDIKPETNTVMG